jgi:uncharacterized cofD-like protein
VNDLLAGLRTSRALKIYVCNIATQEGETDSFTTYDHIRALEEHVGSDLFDVILCNNNFSGTLNSTSMWVRVDEKFLSDDRAHTADLADAAFPWRHDSQKLAQVIMDIYDERTGPLRQ